jgi:hypothetical protein
MAQPPKIEAQLFGIPLAEKKQRESGRFRKRWHTTDHSKAETKAPRSVTAARR